jgi:hypothetical protein
MNKKGSVGDIVIFISVIFVLGLTFYVGSMLWNNVVSPIQNKTQGMIDDPVIETKLNESMESINQTFSILDIIFVIFFFGFYLLLLISVFYLDTHPAFLVFALIGLAIVFILAIVLGDVWINVTTEAGTELTAGGYESATEFPIMNHILSNILTYIIVMSGIFLVILYASKRAIG